jgi:pathogenesis-related protein 1
MMRTFLLASVCAWTAVAEHTKRPGAADGSYTFARELVAAHNQVRTAVGVAPLRWSDELAQLAQKWAETLIESGAFRPRRDHRFGENLFEMSGRAARPYEVVSAWASEAKNYDYRANACSARCGHYEQVVWRDTKSVGCGVARDNRREVWVCNYDPLGNLNGERPY